MNNKDLHKKAEDILTDDSLREMLEHDDSKRLNRGDDDFLVARNILSATRSRKAALNFSDKKVLEERILQSINREKRSRRLIWFSSAAVLVFTLGLTVFLNAQRGSGLKQYATLNDQSYNLGFTRLLLPNNQEIKIETTDSKIDYSANGTEINIDESDEQGQVLSQEATAYNTLVVPYGKRSRVKLPDNTVVWLNSGSKLAYPAKFEQNKREVYLQGEAMFDVSHDEKSPFYVLTSEMDVKVLGTSFNISAYDDDSTVNTVLVRGSVELRYKNKLLGMPASEKMVPGMLAVFDSERKSVVQIKVDPKNFTSWKDGYLVLENSTLGDIAKRLSRYYNVQIEFEKQQLEAETFSGYLDLGSSAIEVMEIISEITGTEVVDDGTVIRIKEQERS
ncbi:FecR family protein [Mangrovibacterium lignilyticum]|uniref:FecR family protein n=1 Tax=Mangrovibacterium lignilyticum TaxID=2668052 RepID=UPI0013D6A398|nr:FecR domain-containing protein [Mangrovibacterium lignilyticum]